jgi:hypothetical protein
MTDMKCLQEISLTPSLLAKQREFWALYKHTTYITYITYVHTYMYFYSHYFHFKYFSVNWRIIWTILWPVFLGLEYPLIEALYVIGMSYVNVGVIKPMSKPYFKVR